MIWHFFAELLCIPNKFCVHPQNFLSLKTFAKLCFLAKIFMMEMLRGERVCETVLKFFGGT